MRKKLLVALAVVLGVLLLFAGYVAMQPSDFRITRTATLSAPPPVVFEQVNDFHKWEAWSPWAKLDPAARNTFEGPSEGEGAIFRWVGNDEVGEGNMTIVESRPNELVRIRLEFIKPFPSVCTTDFTFKPQGEQTSVTWDMTGKNDFIGKAFCLFMDMDKMVGDQFEKGLAQMDSAAKAAARNDEPAGEGEKSSEADIKQ